MRIAKGVQQMDIKRIGSQTSAKGPAEYFTGAVRIDPGLVPAGRKALAWREGNNSHDAHRDCGTAQWEGRRLDGKGQRRTISSVTGDGAMTAATGRELRLRSDSGG